MRLKKRHATQEAILASGRMPRNVVGARQFWQYESDGTEPAKPDPYYLDLRRGKMERQHAITEMAKSYGTADWFGWDYIEREYTQGFVMALRAALGMPTKAKAKE